VSHRARAAQVIAYTSDKRAVIGDLMDALRDPSDDVRNDAMRALAVIAMLGQRNPALGLVVPPTPFVDLLNSIEWTDRNKASFALMALTETRDPTLMAALRARALPSLIEMARWKSEGHSMAAFIVLGRLAGLPDDAVTAAFARGDRDLVLEAAAKLGR
jgi:HEAT repeat protein